MKLLLSFLFTFCICSYTLSSQDLQNLKQEVEKIIEFGYDLNFEEGEGMWIGVIDVDSTFIFPVGNIEADSLSEFQLGSLSKIFTYRIFEDIMDQHHIDETSSITEYLNLNSKFENISLQDLYEQQSLLPKEPYFFGRYSSNPDNPYESYTNDLIVPKLNEYSYLYPNEKEKEFTYGHLNYALLGLTIEKITNQNYCELIESEISSQYPSIMCSDKSNNLVLGFDKAGYPILPWRFPSFSASEGLSSNILDLTNFIRSELMRDADKTTVSKISKHLSFQAPWYQLRLKRSQVTHSFSGTTSSHSVFVCFDKKSQTAVVMMRNSGKGILHLPLTVLEMVKSSKTKSK